MAPHCEPTPTPTPPPARITAGTTVVQQAGASGDPFADGGRWTADSSGDGRVWIHRIFLTPYTITRVEIEALSNSTAKTFSKIELQVYDQDKKWVTVNSLANEYIAPSAIPKWVTELNPPVTGTEVQVVAWGNVGTVSGAGFKIYGRPAE